MSLERIPVPEAEGSGALIPPTATVLSQEVESPEVRSYDISFAQYRNDQCQIDGIGGATATEALKILRDVGVYFSSPSEYLRYAKGRTEIKDVKRDGDYETLYKGLVEEQVWEIKFINEGKGVDLRMFYYTIDTDRMFYLLAVRHTHYDTTKSDFKKPQYERGRRKGRR